MADDISKKITIGVEMDTETLTQNIGNLNKSIDGLVAKQQQLSAAGKQNTAAFEEISAKLDVLKKSLQEANTQLQANTSSLNALDTAAKTAGGSVSSLSDQHQKHTKAAGDSSAKTKELSGQVNTLGASSKATENSVSSLAGNHQKHAKAAADSSNKTKELSTQLSALDKSAKQQKTSTDAAKGAIDSLAASSAKASEDAKGLQTSIGATDGALTQQATDVTSNKTAFDAHKATMDHLKTSFDEIKDVSGIFGPSLQEAAQGFNAMKDGLALVQGGLTGVGEAIKADGFGFLLDILQMLFDSFVKSSSGAKILQGVISATGVVVNDVKAVFHALMDGIINAFSHPIETLKSLGKMIEENLINRFKAFAVILHGIVHLDFKEIGNGVIQAATGVTNATDKMGKVFTAVKKGVEDTAGQMVKAYKDGYNEAGQHVDDHESHVKASVDRQMGYYDKLRKKAQGAYAEQDDGNKVAVRTPTENMTGASVGISPETPDELKKKIQAENVVIVKATQDTAQKTVEIKKTAIQKVEDFAKQSEQKIADAALNILKNSIKQQADAKIAGLEQDKNAELSNRSLTSTQKLAIEQKYKQKEAQVKIKAFKQEQEASIAQAAINGALAITKVTSQAGEFSPLLIPGIITETAIQVATIAAQKPPAYASGGLHYNSDGRGGVLPGYSKTDNTNAYLRSGEGVVVSEAMQVPWARNLISAINVGFGGRDFSITNPGRGYAVGGIFTDGGDANRYYNQPVHDQKNLANSIAYQMINNFPPVYVDVKDINNQQNILAQTVNRVNL
ncbi:hypothetical protein [Mucilaginibacter sp.]|uniref:hypothetical protein n=1 Tax=Mucilaginibacter sp. TaxID=1882438 RepID=UPI00285072B4|nr:hypothetical protein [Mucilaginibacter sp.]MDR3693377.1 hypothetical protein [Mucilaginibacter sp.]